MSIRRRHCAFERRGRLIGVKGTFPTDTKASFLHAAEEYAGSEDLGDYERAT
jgi:hypothetical protein